MQGILYEEASFWTFAIVSLAIGGWFAWMTGRAMALTWRSYIETVLCFLLTTAGVRFLHHAMFQGTFLSLHFYIVDACIAILIGSLGYQVTRTRLMTRQYRWLYERTSPVTWRKRSEPA